jgi:hypothetical protein
MVQQKFKLRIFPSVVLNFSAYWHSGNWKLRFGPSREWIARLAMDLTADSRSWSPGKVKNIRFSVSSTPALGPIHQE